MTWRLEATIGDLTFTVTPREPDDPPPAPPALLTASWIDSLVDDGAWPAVQDVSTGQLTLLFATAAEAAAYRSTTPVSLQLYRPSDGTTPVATFAGRTTDPVLTPARDGVEVTFGLADYLADLGERTQGGYDYPQEGLIERLDRMFTDSNVTPPPWPPFATGGGQTSYPLAARPKAAASLLALAQEAVASTLQGPALDFSGDPDDDPILFEIRPNLTPAGQLDPTAPWLQVELPRDTPDSTETIPAAAVTLGGTWSRSKFSDVNTVHVLTANGEVERVNNREATEPRVLYRRQTQLYNEGNAYAADLARYLLPDEAFVPGWEADTFTVHLDRTPDDYWPGHLRDVRTLTGLQERHNPDGTTTYKGVVTKIETRLDRGKVTADVTLSSRPITAAPEPPASTRDDEVAADAPLFWYKFNETSGPVAVNDGSVGDSHDATYRNAPTLSGEHVTLNGVNQDVLIPFHSSFERPAGDPSLNQPLTIEARIRLAPGATGSYVIAGRNAGNDSTLYFGVKEGALRLTTKFLTEDRYGTALVNDGEWHDVAVVITRPTSSYTLSYRFVVDGAVDVEGTISDSSGSTAGMCIGSRGGSVWFAGDIADLMIYDTAVTTERLLAHHEATTTP